MAPEFLKNVSASAAPAAEENPGATTPFAAEIFAKQPFKGYTLLAALASTDRTAVFRAHDAMMERTVAVKVLRPCRGREGAVEEFFSLAGSIARLRCPGLARGLDAGRGGGDFFLVHEFARGENLALRLARRQSGKIAERDSLRLAIGVARALHGLFGVGHSHGRLTPANCVQGPDGGVTLTDIGFAWTAGWRTDAEAFAARPDFLPPERIAGEFNVDVRGDLYSLGCILFRCLSGRNVFGGATPEETLEMHLRRRPEALRKLDEKITEDTSLLVRWLLEKDRDARPRTPKEFLTRLSRHPLLAGGGDAAAGNADGAENEPDETGEGAVKEVERLLEESR